MHDIAIPNSLSRRERLKVFLKRWLGQRIFARLTLSAGEFSASVLRLRRRLRFDLRTWEPRGPVASYLNYYPDSLQPTVHLKDLYYRWIRGNKTNNNGDASRFIALVLNLRQLEAEGIPGDFAELGVWKGNSAAVLADFAGRSNRRLFLFDTFTGFDERDFSGLDSGQTTHFADTSVEYVKQTVGHVERSTYVQGYFPESLTDELSERTFALVHIDCDLYEPMKAALAFFYPRMPRGGMMVLHDYSSGCWDGAKKAIDDFCVASGEFVSLWPDKSGTAMIRKTRCPGR